VSTSDLVYASTSVESPLRTLNCADLSSSRVTVNILVPPFSVDVVVCTMLFIPIPWSPLSSSNCCGVKSEYWNAGPTGPVAGTPVDTPSIYQ